MPFTSEEKKQIKSFVQDFCDGKILTSQQLISKGNGNLISMVFIPFFFAAVEPPQNTLPEPPVKPSKQVYEQEEWGDVPEGLVAEYEQRMKSYVEEKQKRSDEWLKNIGVIWEYYSEATPRTINGFPIFLSCRILPTKLWKAATKLIPLELERRQQFHDMEFDWESFKE